MSKLALQGVSVLIWGSGAGCRYQLLRVRNGSLRSARRRAGLPAGALYLLLAVSVPTARSVRLPRIALALASHGGVAAL